MGNIKALSVALLLIVATNTGAYAFCFDEAGVQYGINPLILRAIAKVESNLNPNALNWNSNGTYDFGLMQINSSWAATIGEERWNALGDACYNTMTGAWILATCMNKYGYSWKAIGCYNSQTPEKRDKYARMVFEQLQRIERNERKASAEPVTKHLETTVRNRTDDGNESTIQPYHPVPPEVLRQPPSIIPEEEPALPDSSGAQVAAAPATEGNPAGM